MKQSMKTSREKERKLENLSPFELKNSLIDLASEANHRFSNSMLNAGRGNPNWIATFPREAFFTLGLFGIEECRRVKNKDSGRAGTPKKKNIGSRFEAFLDENPDLPGINLLKNIYWYGLDVHHFDKDNWAMELTEGVLGNQYPFPVRILEHTEKIIHDYLIKEMCNGEIPPGTKKYDLFATEGGTAAICYIFDSLIDNFLLQKGDTIALGVPAFTPYLEIPALERYNFKMVRIHGSAKNKDGEATFQYPETELDKLQDQSIKCLFVINPSNPTSVAIDQNSLDYLVKTVREYNPCLMIITDDVYGTFVPGFQSLIRFLPRNTICVYSFSKYFGATGWRLGVIALDEENVYDEMLSRLSAEKKDHIKRLYESLSLHPLQLKFIDRLVADSRRVALNHTAGLSLPQQIQMMLFAAFALLDQKNNYKKSCIRLINKRYHLLWEGLNIPVIPDPNRAGYYCEFDVMEWAIRRHGKEFGDYLQLNFEPVDILFRLAEETAIVLLNGGGFGGPAWSVRVSLANLRDENYRTIGKALNKILNEYIELWLSTK